MSKPDWNKIRKEWETSNITLKALAEKHNVKLGTLKSRKSREKWSRDATKKDATKNKKVATPKKKVATTKKQNKRELKEPTIENDELTDKQRLFCIYYIKYFNATKAYQKAYECDYFTAKTNGSRLLTKANIISEIERLKKEQRNGLMLDVRDVLQKYIDIAFADITDYVEFGTKEIIQKDAFGQPIMKNGKPVMEKINHVNLTDFENVDGTIITEVKQGRDGITVKLADKMKALEMLSKYFDLLSENDKKRLQEEKLKAETAKAKAEAEKIANEQKQEAPPTIMIIDEWSDDNE